MAKADGPRSVLVAFRVAPDLREAMQRAAEDESRSLSNWIMVACKKALAERKAKG